MGKGKNKCKHNHKHIDHEPQEESTKAVFGDPKAHGEEFTPKTFKKAF